MHSLLLQQQAADRLQPVQLLLGCVSPPHFFLAEEFMDVSQQRAEVVASRCRCRICSGVGKQPHLQTWLLLVSLVVLDIHHLTNVRHHQREAVDMLGGARLSWRVGGCWVALRWGRLHLVRKLVQSMVPLSSAVRVYRRYAGTLPNK